MVEFVGCDVVILVKGWVGCVSCLNGGGLEVLQCQVLIRTKHRGVREFDGSFNVFTFGQPFASFDLARWALRLYKPF